MELIRCLHAVLIFVLFRIWGRTAHAFEIGEIKDVWDKFDLGYYDMSLGQKDGVNCDTINWKDAELSTASRRNLRPRAGDGIVRDGLCDHENEPCARMVFLNAFPGGLRGETGLANVSIDGQTIMTNVSGKTFVLSSLFEIYEYSEIATIQANLYDYFSDAPYLDYFAPKRSGRVAPEDRRFAVYASLDEAKQYYDPGSRKTPSPSFSPTINATPPTLSPTVSNIPTPVPSLSTLPTPLPSVVPLPRPSAVPSSRPSYSVAPTKTYYPSPSPSEIPTPAPTPKKPRYTHPYLFILGHSTMKMPYGRLWGFNQTKYDDLTAKGTPVLFINAIPSNVTVSGKDERCVGEYANTTLQNRTFYTPKDPVMTICVKNHTAGSRVPIANVSFMDMSYAYFTEGINEDDTLLKGELYLFKGPDPDTYPPTAAPTSSMPSSTPAPSPVPSFVPSAMPTPNTTRATPDQAVYVPDDPCSGEPIAETSYYFEANRIWYVAVVGSQVKDLGDDGPYYTRYMSYEFLIFDEYGGPTPMPTMLPTTGATAVYIPMEAYPFRANYNYLIYTSFAFAFGGVILFVMTRTHFNAAEERSPGKWPI